MVFENYRNTETTKHICLNEVFNYPITTAATTTTSFKTQERYTQTTNQHPIQRRKVALSIYIIPAYKYQLTPHAHYLRASVDVKSRGYGLK